MENVRYIPGDLVKLKYNGKAYHISKIIPSIYNDIIHIQSVEDGCLCVEHKDKIKEKIEGVPLTPQILEANGWKRDGGQYYFSFASYTGDKVELMGFFIEMFKEPHDMLKYKYFQITHEYKVICGCFYCHQLQHLLFGLGLSFDLKV